MAWEDIASELAGLDEVLDEATRQYKARARMQGQGLKAAQAQRLRRPNKEMPGKVAKGKKSKGKKGKSEKKAPPSEKRRAPRGSDSGTRETHRSKYRLHYWAGSNNKVKSPMKRLRGMGPTRTPLLRNRTSPWRGGRIDSEKGSRKNESEMAAFDQLIAEALDEASSGRAPDVSAKKSAIVHKGTVPAGKSAVAHKATVASSSKGSPHKSAVALKSAVARERSSGGKQEAPKSAVAHKGTTGKKSAPKSDSQAPRSTRTVGRTNYWDCRKISAYKQMCRGRKGEVNPITIKVGYKKHYNQAYKRWLKVKRRHLGKYPGGKYAAREKANRA
jgi:hypothetical protein